MTLQQIHKEFDEKYLKSVSDAYPEFSESHLILLNDIKAFYQSAITELLKEKLTIKDFDTLLTKLRQAFLNAEPKVKIKEIIEEHINERR